MAKHHFEICKKYAPSTLLLSYGTDLLPVGTPVAHAVGIILTLTGALLLLKITLREEYGRNPRIPLAEKASGEKAEK